MELKNQLQTLQQFVDDMRATSSSLEKIKIIKGKEVVEIITNNKKIKSHIKMDCSKTITIKKS